MKLKFKLFLMFIFVCFFLSGCTQQQQLSERFNVKGIGIDLNNSKYTLTLQGFDFQNPKSKDEPNLKTIESEGKSVMEALGKIKKQSGLNPLYSQNLIVIIGEDLAKQGIENFFDFFIRHVETRPRVKVCIVRGKAKEILTFKVENKLVNAKDISDIIPDALNSDVLHFIGSIKSNISSPYAANLKIENAKIVDDGIAVFKDDLLIDVINSESFGFGILKGVSKSDPCIIETEKDGIITCNIEQCSSKIDCSIEKNTPVFEVNISVGVAVFEFNRYIYTHENATKNLIEQKISEKISNECSFTIEKLKNLNCDILNYGKHLRNSHNAYFQAYKQNIKNLMKNAKFKIKTKASVILTGKEPI